MKLLQPFVNRRRELADLDAFLKTPPSGPAQHRALIAARRIGKTELIREFRRRHPTAFLPLIEVQTADLTAAGFVRHLLLAYLVALSRPKVAPVPINANIISLAAPLSAPLRQNLLDLLNVADQTVLPDHELRGQALRFGEDLLADVKRRGILFLDECQSWFAPPGESPSAMEKVLAQVVNQGARLRLVVSGSAQRVMEATFRESAPAKAPRRPLYGRFGVLYLAELSSRDCKDLVDKLWKGQTYSAESNSRVFTLTRGHPGALVTVAEAASLKGRAAGSDITPDLVAEAFVDSLFEPLGLLNALAEADYNGALAAVRTTKTMARLLQTIAELGPVLATGTEISKRANVKQPNLKQLLTPLLHSDLLRFDETTKTYRFSNAFLPMWLRGRDVWVQSGSAGQPYVTTLQIVQEELERYRSEVADSAEARARDTAGRFDGGTLPGALFGRPRTLVTLPNVTTPVRAIDGIDRDGIAFPKGTPVQLDIHVEGRSAWLGEVKTRGRVTAAMLKALKDKAKVLRHEKKADAKALWFVSSSGFDKKLLDYATANDIFLSRATDLRKMNDLLKQPPSSPARNRPGPKTP